jgi:hypothetical protein
MTLHREINQFYLFIAEFCSTENAVDLTEMYSLRHASLQIYCTMICFQDIDRVRFGLHVK